MMIQSAKTHFISLILFFLLCLFLNVCVVTIANAYDQDTIIKQNEERIDKLREQKRFFESLLNDPDKWVLALRGIPVAVRRDEVIKAITVFYYRELLNKRAKFDRNELARRIKITRDFSSSFKADFRKEISLLNKRIIKLEVETKNLKPDNGQRIDTFKETQVFVFDQKILSKEREKLFKEFRSRRVPGAPTAVTGILYPGKGVIRAKVPGWLYCIEQVRDDYMNCATSGSDLKNKNCWQILKDGRKKCDRKHKAQWSWE